MFALLRYSSQVDLQQVQKALRRFPHLQSDTADILAGPYEGKQRAWCVTMYSTNTAPGGRFNEAGCATECQRAACPRYSVPRTRSWRHNWVMCRLDRQHLCLHLALLLARRSPPSHGQLALARPPPVELVALAAQSQQLVYQRSVFGRGCVDADLQAIVEELDQGVGAGRVLQP